MNNTIGGEQQKLPRTHAPIKVYTCCCCCTTAVLPYSFRPCINIDGATSPSSYFTGEGWGTNTFYLCRSWCGTGPVRGPSTVELSKTTTSFRELARIGVDAT